MRTTNVDLTAVALIIIAVILAIALFHGWGG